MVMVIVFRGRLYHRSFTKFGLFLGEDRGVFLQDIVGVCVCVCLCLRLCT